MLRVHTALFLAASVGFSSTATLAEEAKTASPASDTPFSELHLVAFDTETTGLSPKSDRIVEIGVTRFEQGVPGEQHSWLINPGRDIPGYATKVHGISNDEVADQPPFAEVYPRFIDFAGEEILLAHNASFDIRFITAEVTRNDLEPPPNGVIDTLKLFRAWFPDAPSHNLGNLAAYAGIETGKLHRAEADATMMLRILQKGAEDRDGEVSLGDLVRDAGGLMRFGK